ncbi:MAG: 4a-hydroxytetrahydrobiopterin dehydratase [Thermoleophilaceae bacterium]|nr:4a-hydroxytetrahydrobiopterin dehydratase [Thermoleophilaceae bacterium]
MALLTAAEIDQRLSEVDGWALRGASIEKQFDCGDFVGSVNFLNAVTPVAEALAHHPDVAISWRTVTVTITSHSAGGLTANDFVLAHEIDKLA